MNKLLALAALGLLVLPVSAQAEDHNDHSTPTDHAAPADDKAPVQAESKTETSTAVEVNETTLKDGTKVSIEGDSVFVIGADGEKTPAPDATHELKDGTHVTTVSGKVVHDADTDAHSQ